ncbi:P22 phage major capsid protein family protein [Stackebrandtia soli]|uniref:P22 phage major capsid protein family protein n=1 Tax=Stackebrandtia soli TaxID=1892856 RepID=UPI0039EAFB01
MANEFLKPQVIAATALGLLERDIVLPGLVWRDAVADWTGNQGDTVSIRVPARTKARRRALRAEPAPIVADRLRETKVDVSLAQQVYSAVDVTDAELTLDITDFGAQVLAPQVRAIAEDIENQVAEAMSAAPYVTTLTLDVAKPDSTFVDARQALNAESVPVADRVAVVGTDVEAAILKADVLTNADQAGDNTALRDAEIGRLRGVPVVLSTAIDPGTAYVFHRTAFVLGLRAPVVPDGATFGQSQSYADLAMTWLRDYSSDYLRDRSVVHTFTGVNHVLDAPPNDPAADPSRFVRAVKITMPTAPASAAVARKSR